jgi:hypothetical protein
VRRWALALFGVFVGVSMAPAGEAGVPIAKPGAPTVARPKGPVQLAGVPVLVSPRCGATLTNSPRTLTMSWEPVGGATSYDVEVDCMNCHHAWKWDSQTPSGAADLTGITGTSAAYTFPSDNPGRWRVRANRGSVPQPWSGWCDFTFRTGGASRVLVRPRGLDRRPDITGTAGGMTISGNFFPHTVDWGGKVTLEESEAIGRANGGCAFNIHYDMANVGGSPTAPYAPPAPGPRFMNIVYDDAIAASKQTDLYLAVGAVEGIDTQAYLKPGTHTLKLSLDDGNAIKESDESNNTRSLTYVLNGTCGK